MERIRFAPLFSGSSGNAALLEAGDAHILVDAGMPARSIERAFHSVGRCCSQVNALLITHEHVDHICGAGALCRKYGIPVYANAATWEAMEDKLGKIPPHAVRVFETGRGFCIKGVEVLPFKTPHDAAESVGYAFSANGRRVVTMTDIGHVDESLIDIAAGCDLVLIESNHDVDMLKAGPYPYPLKRRILSEVGHLSNVSAGAALAEFFARGVKSAILGHLSRENNYAPLALATVRAILCEQQVPEGEFQLVVARRERPTGVFIVE
ncbi:MAG: MBL fold metallo-hydrolase [Bacillota bacterium]